MKKTEAIEAMKSGARISHPTFTEQEWITMEGNLTIITEEGYAVSTVEFWKYRNHPNFNDGWFIFGTKNNNHYEKPT